MVQNILAIIPARGGSKSIPKKNIKLLGGKPLLAYAIDLAKSVPAINKIIVSTDSEEIAEIAKKHGAEVPFIRPSELADDKTPTLPVLQHCVKFLEQNGYKADLVLLFFPTCPFLKKETVENAINILNEGEYNSVMSVAEDYGRFWEYSKTKNKYIPFYPKNYVNRQYYKPLLKENGAIYFSKYSVTMSEDKLSGKDTRLIDKNSVKLIVMGSEEMVDIDTPFDWKKAEERIKEDKQYNS